MPPNGHGLVVLMALDIASGFTFSKRDDVESLHRQIEAMKLAFCDGKKYIADPRFMKTAVDDWLSPAYATGGGPLSATRPCFRSRSM